jgi:hypothetical protein
MFLIILALMFQVNLPHKYKTMPRLSLYRPNRTYDYQYLDKVISEQYTVGGLDIYIHKYLGPKTGDVGDADATLPVYDSSNPLFVEDLLLGENRDRSYDPDIFIMRGVYRVQDIDFDLTQFGLFLNNDTLFITFHYNDMIDTFGRKLMSGDVLEFPNLRDYNPLNTALVKSLPRYYVIQDAAFASEGFSQTWLPHLWRVKATPLVNAQEYQDIMNQPFMPDNVWDPGNFYPNGFVVKDGDTYYQANGNVPAGTPIDAVNPSTGQPYWTEITNPDTLGDKGSTRPKDLEINDAILTQAYAEVPYSGYDTVKFYILPTTENGQPASTYGGGLTADNTDVTVDGTQPGEGITPRGFGYTMGYLSGSKDPNTGYLIPPNGLPVTPGVSFPPTPVAGDYALRLDYFPNRLFRYDGARWIKIEEDVRTDLDLATNALTQRASFVNNTYTVPTTDLGNIPSRQSLSEILKPQADNGDQGGNLPPNPRPPGR